MSRLVDALRALAPKAGVAQVSASVVADLINLMELAARRNARNGQQSAVIRLDELRFHGRPLPRARIEQIEAHFETQGLRAQYCAYLDCGTDCGLADHAQGVHFGYVLAWD